MKFFKKHKKGLIILGVILLVIIGIVIWIKASIAKGMEILSQAMSSETAVVQRRDLVSVVSATGKITSIDKKDLTSVATGTKVLSVNAEVGDTVNEGDILIVLDSEEIEENLKNSEDSLDTTKKSNSLSLSSAQRRYNETVTSIDVSNKRMQDQISDAQKKVDDYKKLKEQAESQYAQAASNRAAIEAQYNSGIATVRAAEADLALKMTALLDASENDPGHSSPTYLAAVDDVSAGEAAVREAKDSVNVTALSQSLETAKAAESKWLSEATSYASQVAQYEASLESTKKSKEDTDRNNASTLASSKESLDSTKLSSKNATTQMEKQIDLYEDQLKECTIRAPFTGLVTSINVKEGDKYSGMTLLSLEDVSSYEVTTEIDEYDIGKVKKGQKVVIKTNGTGDAELEGVVKSVAPKATVSAQGLQSSGSVTYTVVVSVLTKNDDLKLDMTAKLSIIREASENTLTIPYDALQLEDDGREFVNVIDGRDEKGLMKTHKVYVKSGIKSSYYIEILEGDLKENDEVEVKREASDTFDFSQFLSVEPSSGM